MLQGFSTKNGTGIIIYGDYCDLRSLYLTISKVSDKVATSQDDPQFITLMSFSYELRKAYSEQRDKEKITFDGEKEIEYYGFQFLWPDMLVFLNILRHLAAYTLTEAIDQANMYLLEHITQKALDEYDIEGAAELKRFLKYGIDITDPLLVQINEYINIKYLESRPSKKRFRGLCDIMINHFSAKMQDGKALRDFLEVKAKEMNISANKIRFADEEFPDIVW